MVSASPPFAAPNSISAFVVPRARCSNQLLEHLEHLHETNDLFGNLAKSQSEGKWMSLLLKVVAELIDPVMASFELGPCDMAEQDSMHDVLIPRRTTWEVNLGR